jgi:hypothetical protein
MAYAAVWPPCADATDVRCTMAKKDMPKQTSQKKLALRKETIRDLTTRKGNADGVRGAAATLRKCIQ